ncbi:hypothetical protein JZ751_019334, partial [Albula glossodonta]
PRLFCEVFLTGVALFCEVFLTGVALFCEVFLTGVALLAAQSGRSSPSVAALAYPLRCFCADLGRTFMAFVRVSGDFCQAQHLSFVDK